MRDQRRPGAVDDDDGRVAAALVRIAELDAPPVHRRGRVAAHRRLQNAGQIGCGEVARPRLPCALGAAEQIAHSGAVQCRDEVHARKIRESQLAFEALPGVAPLLRAESVPLVEREHDGPSGVENHAHEMGVLIGHAFPGVHEHYGDLGRLDGPQ